MILTRPGNKTRIADKIIPYFHPAWKQCYIEPFFGAGGMFFSLPQKPKHAILNDSDSDVFNLWSIMRERPGDLRAAYENTPWCEAIFQHWKRNKESDPVMQAVRFLFLSNMAYLGTESTFAISVFKLAYYSRFLNAFEAVKSAFWSPNVQIIGKDCIELINNVHFTHGLADALRTFFYCDPPYIGTKNTYESGQSWGEPEFSRLLDNLQSTGAWFAVSEFDHPFVVEQAKTRGLNIETIGERKNMKNRRTEILLTNYKQQNILFP